MFPLQLLRPPLAHYMALRIQVPMVGTPAVGIKMTNPKRLKQRLEFHQYLICTAAKSIGYVRPV